MTLQQFLNKILLPFRMQVNKAPKGIKIYGVNWIEDVARLMGNGLPSEIFDIGANCGQTTKRLANAFPMAKIRAFEPTPSTFKKLQDRVKEFPNVECHNMGMGSENKKAEFNLRDHHESNSFLDMVPESEALYPAKEKILIDMMTLDSYAEKEGIHVIDILKINAEGYDYRILQGAGSLLRDKRIRYVFVEVMFKPLFQGEATLGDFNSFMQGAWLWFCRVLRVRLHQGTCGASRQCPLLCP